MKVHSSRQEGTDTVGHALLAWFMGSGHSDMGEVGPLALRPRHGVGRLAGLGLPQPHQQRASPSAPMSGTVSPAQDATL